MMRAVPDEVQARPSVLELAEVNPAELEVVEAKQDESHGKLESGPKAKSSPVRKPYVFLPFAEWDAIPPMPRFAGSSSGERLEPSQEDYELAKHEKRETIRMMSMGGRRCSGAVETMLMTTREMPVLITPPGPYHDASTMARPPLTRQVL